MTFPSASWKLEEKVMIDLIPWFATIIALGSLVISILSLYISNNNHRRSNALQQQLVTIEKQRERDRRKANLFAEARKIKSGQVEFMITNTGESAARNLSIMLDDIPIEEHPTNQRKQKIPSLIVSGEKKIICYLFLNDLYSQSFRTKITWDDDSGKNQVYENSLTVR